MSGSKRLGKEYADLAKEPIQGVSIQLVDENLYKWTALIKGAASPYKGGTFALELDFPVEYPFKAPKARFATRVFHPNVDEEGNLCVGMLKSDAWKPSTKAATVLLAAVNLLGEPEPDDALVASIAEMYKTDRAKFDKTAAEYTKKYASSS